MPSCYIMNGGKETLKKSGDVVYITPLETVQGVHELRQRAFEPQLKKLAH